MNKAEDDAMNDRNPEDKPKNNTRLITLLAISLAFNLLLIGLIIGWAAAPERDRQPHLGWMTHNLDRETRSILRDKFKEHRQASQPIREELRAAQRQLHEVLSAEDFDAEAASQALATLRGVSSRFQTLAHRQMVETLATMKPEDRVHVYRFLARPVSRGKPKAEPRERQ